MSVLDAGRASARLPPGLAAAARRATRDRSFWRRLPTELGGQRFLASTEGGLRFLRRRFWESEPILSEFARVYVTPGSVVWDVGANVGFFTFAAAGLAGPRGHVVAVEPDPWLIHRLRRSARALRGAAPVDVMPCAASDVAGDARFTVARQSRATSHLAAVRGSSQEGGSREEHPVVTLPLDALLDHHHPPSVVKIDVERAEALVLRGATRILADARPVMLIEVGHTESASVTTLLHDAGYALVDGATGRTSDRAVWATIAVPEAAPRG